MTKKKTSIIFILLCMVVLLSACKGKEDENNSPAQEGKVTETVTPTASGEEVSVTPEVTEAAPATEASISDYFPFRENKQYFYEGEGNEYASFWNYPDYQDKDSKRLQLRTDNGGTEVVQVLEISNGTLAVITSKEESYYRDNLLQYNSDKDPEVLLKEPLVKGTEWTLSDGRKRYISETGKNISTPYGDYDTIEVTTEESEGSTKEYYAKNIGLLKRVYTSADSSMTVTSVLKEIKETPLVQKITVYYPDIDKEQIEESKSISYQTNDITRLKMQELFREKYNDNMGLISENTKINSLYKGEDGVVYVDFSGEFVTEMNAGVAFESYILRAVADTLGTYYDAGEVYLTVNQKPYESGHVLMEEGETLKVNR